MSTNSYYEAHITILGVPADTRYSVEYLKWKFSAIDEDPTLGKGIKCYATKHFKANLSKEEVLATLHRVADTLVSWGFSVIRRKIELVIYDDRSSTVRFQCKGTCPECHVEDYNEKHI